MGHYLKEDIFSDATETKGKGPRHDFLGVRDA
jgi:hypothetical protein